MNKKNQLGHMERFGPATRNSIKGLKAAYQNEVAFRQETFLLIVTTPIACFIAQNFIEFVLLMSGILIIMIAELLNSAVEAAIDRIGLEQHELSGRAKDLGSAAVFVAICYCVLVWVSKLSYYFLT